MNQSYSANMMNLIARLFRKREACVSVYKRGDGYILHPNKRSTAGVWVSTEPCIRVELNADRAVIGKQIFDLLAQCEGTVEHPKNLKDGFGFVLQFAKVRSYKQFMNNCKHCGIFLRGDKICFYPYRNEHSRGFHQLIDAMQTIDYHSSEDEYGERLLSCINNSE